MISKLFQAIERQKIQMSKEAVLEIREAEARARKIIEDAYSQSRKMINDAEACSSRECSDFEAAIKDEYRASINEVRAGVQQIVDKHKADDDKKYTASHDIAMSHINEAVKIILQGVMSECQ